MLEFFLNIYFNIPNFLSCKCTFEEHFELSKTLNCIFIPFQTLDLVSKMSRLISKVVKTCSKLNSFCVKTSTDIDRYKLGKQFVQIQIKINKIWSPF